MPPDPLVVDLPFKLVNYTVNSRISRGGQAVVFSALDERLQIPVAIKVPLEKYQPRAPGEVDNFLREPRIVARINHPNVVRLLSVMEPPPWYCTAYELADGDLSHFIAGSDPDGTSVQLPFQFILRAGYQISLGLEIIHVQEFVHRDLKLRNILWFKDPAGPGSHIFRIGDFGLARHLPPMDRARTIVGTVPYMAPEVFSATGSYQSDIYSLGVILYEMTTGRLPHPYFENESLAVYVSRILETDPLPPSRLRPDVPARLNALILEAISRKPENRIPTARGLRDRIAKLLGDEELDIILDTGLESGSPDVKRWIPDPKVQQPFRVRVWTDRPGDLQFRDLACVPRFENNAARIGDKVRISCAAERDVHITLVNIGPTGNISILFPNAHASGNFLRSDEVLRVPGAGHGFDYVLQGPAGRETIIALATLSPVKVTPEDVLKFSSDYLTLPAGSQARDIAIRKIEATLGALPRETWSQSVCYLDVMT